MSWGWGEEVKKKWVNVKGACLMQCYLTALWLRWSKFVYQPGRDVMFCFLSSRFKCDRPKYLTSLYMTEWQHGVISYHNVFSFISILCTLVSWFWKLLIQNLNQGAVSWLDTGPVNLFMWTSQLACKGVRTEGHKRETTLSSPLKTVLRSAVMQAGLGSQTWPGAFGVAWWKNSGGKSRPAWVNERIRNIFHSLWKADTKRESNDCNKCI